MFASLQLLLMLLAMSSQEAVKESATSGFPLSATMNKISQVTDTLPTELKNNSFLVTSSNRATRSTLLPTKTATEPTTTETTSCSDISITDTTTGETTPTEMSTVETTSDETTLESTTEKTTTSLEITMEATLATQQVTEGNASNEAIMGISNSKPSDANANLGTFNTNGIDITTVDVDVSITTKEASTVTPHRGKDFDSHGQNSFDSSTYQTNGSSNSKSNEKYNSGSSEVADRSSNSYGSDMPQKDVSQSYVTEIMGYDEVSQNSSFTNASVDIDINISIGFSNSTLKPESPKKRATTRKLVVGILLIVLISISVASTVIFVMMPIRRRRKHREYDSVELLSGRGRYQPVYKYYDASLYIRR